NARDVLCRAKDDAALDFDDTATFAPLVYLCVTQFRVQDAFGFFARSSWPSFEWRGFGCTVVSAQSRHISREFVAGKQGA
ncbi:MAG: hypothetical protein C4294_19175, partial [Nitrospiraceae bacterium]